MRRIRYCECGRRIKVRLRGKWIAPQSDHDQCRKCYRSQRESHRDSLRQAREESEELPAGSLFPVP